METLSLTRKKKNPIPPKLCHNKHTVEQTPNLVAKCVLVWRDQGTTSVIIIRRVSHKTRQLRSLKERHAYGGGSIVLLGYFSSAGTRVLVKLEWWSAPNTHLFWLQVSVRQLKMGWNDLRAMHRRFFDNLRNLERFCKEEWQNCEIKLCQVGRFFP